MGRGIWEEWVEKNKGAYFKVRYRTNGVVAYGKYGCESPWSSHGCLRASVAVGLSRGSNARQHRMNCFASVDTHSHGDASNVYSPARTLRTRSSSSTAKNGGAPPKRTKTTTPTDHMSAGAPYSRAQMHSPAKSSSVGCGVGYQPRTSGAT